MSLLTRRRFGCRIAGMVGGGLSLRTGLSLTEAAGTVESFSRLLYVSHGRTFLFDLKTGASTEFEFEVPDQATWQAAGCFPDGQRILFLSMEARRDGPGRPFDEYYTQTPTHIWIHDLRDGSLREVATSQRRAVFYTPQLLLGSDRMLVQVVSEGVGQIFNMALDGSDQIEFTKAGEGLPYGCDLSPDGSRIAYHLASPRGYEIWTSDLQGENRVRVSGDPDRLFFGPKWSPDGDWLTFQECRHRNDPGHDWSDLVVSRPDGSEQRRLTLGQSHWFGATYGRPNNRGGGSNMLAWTRDGGILYSRRLPKSKVPWEYQIQRKDIDHYNRDFKPESAKGGTEIHRLNPGSGESVKLTMPGEGAWDCRAQEGPGGNSIVFCRAKTGEMPALWLLDRNGKNARSISSGTGIFGADHPQWMPDGLGI